MLSEAQLDALVKALEAWGPLIASGYEVPAAGQVVLNAATAITTLRQQLASAQADEKRGLLLTDLERRAVIEAIRIMFEDGSSEPSHKPAERVLRKLGHPRYS